MDGLAESICDEVVYSQVFREYSDTLFRYLYYQCGDEELSKDITQEAFVKLWQNCALVNLQTAKGYVFKTAKNNLLNVYDHQKVKLRFRQRKHQSHTDQNPEYLMVENELREQLERAISDLPEKQRVAFLMSRIEKKTYKEIAEILGISRQAVEKRIYNALDTLRHINKNIK